MRFFFLLQGWQAYGTFKLPMYGSENEAYEKRQSRIIKCNQRYGTQVRIKNTCECVCVCLCVLLFGV